VVWTHSMDLACSFLSASNPRAARKALI